MKRDDLLWQLYCRTRISHVQNIAGCTHAV